MNISIDRQELEDLDIALHYAIRYVRPTQSSSINLDKEYHERFYKLRVKLSALLEVTAINE